MDTTFSIEEAFKNPSIGGNPFKITDLGLFISNVLEILMILAAIATLVYLVWGGLEWITSGGDKAGTEKAKSKITDAVIGLVIVFSAWAIFQLLQTFLGFQVTEKTVSTSTSASKTDQQAKPSCVLETKKYNWVLAKNSSCIKNEGIDWNGCWRTHITKFPCDNFYIAGDDYWWKTYPSCPKPAPLCP